MDARTIIFYLLAATVIGGGLMAVTSRKIFRSAVFLLFSLIGIAGFYFFLDQEFIAAVQVVVYVGGIVVLILFSIFLTHGSGEDMKKPALGRAVFSALAAAIGCVLTMYLISEHTFQGSGKPALEPSAGNIGAQMLSVTEYGFILPFEVVSMLLLAAMIGCIVIAIKVKVPEQKVMPKIKEETEPVELEVVEELKTEEV
ncbi:MAG: NADH-quinone oxidoreductase subunit [Flavipsychrobacter sp.]|jgi:NADH-quinone oxidoreductase subunit J|nr:NADH-quinone oxidoreductase subunit [Flavipsychrobacter sp.]